MKKRRRKEKKRIEREGEGKKEKILKKDMGFDKKKKNETRIRLIYWTSLYIL